MKILIVSCYLPPVGTAVSCLVENLCRCFKNSGHQIDGITIKQSLYDDDVTNMIGGRVFHANYIMSCRSGKKRIKDFAFLAYKHLLTKLFPNKNIVYKWMCVKSILHEMRKRNAYMYDVIIAVCASYDAMEAVVRYKQRYNYSGKIVLYQVDPLRENIVYQSDGDEFLSKLENRYLTNCDCIVTTPLINSVKRKQWPIKNVVVAEFPAVDPVPYNKEQNEHIVCLYAGQLYRDLRNPIYTLDLFSAISDPEIHIYFVGSGCEDLLKEYGNERLKGRLHVLGKLTVPECNKWLEKADVLVNIGNSVSNMTPSKLFTYISYRKPILNIYKTIECPTLHYLKCYTNVLNIQESSHLNHSTVDAVKQWIKNSSQNLVSIEDVLCSYEKFIPEYVSKQIMDGICMER